MTRHETQQLCHAADSHNLDICDSQLQTHLERNFLQNISEKHSTVGLSAFGPFACFDALHVVSCSESR